MKGNDFAKSSAGIAGGDNFPLGRLGLVLLEPTCRPFHHNVIEVISVEFRSAELSPDYRRLCLVPRFVRFF